MLLMWLKYSMALDYFLRMMALQRDEIDTTLRSLPATDEVQLPLTLSLAPALLQLALNLGIITENHVSVQSLLRLLLTAFKMERSFPAETFGSLRAFNETIYSRFGQASAYLQRGAGTSGAKAPMTTAQFVANSNGGSFHPRKIRAGLPAADYVMGEARPCSVLNFIAAAIVGSNSTYIPAANKQVVVALTSSDGLMLKRGLDFCEAENRT